MEFSDLDLPDYRDDLEADDSFRPPARDALLTAMLEHVDTNAVATALTMTTPQVVLIKAPTADWAKAIADLVGKTYNQTYATAIVDLKKYGNASTTKDVQRRLTSGRHYRTGVPGPRQHAASAHRGGGRRAPRSAQPHHRKWLRRPSSSSLASGRQVSSWPTLLASISVSWNEPCAMKAGHATACSGSGAPPPVRHCRWCRPVHGSRICR